MRSWLDVKKAEREAFLVISALVAKLVDVHCTSTNLATNAEITCF
jgi:hypothetical protein